MLASFKLPGTTVPLTAVAIRPALASKVATFGALVMKRYIDRVWGRSCDSGKNLQQVENLRDESTKKTHRKSFAAELDFHSLIFPGASAESFSSSGVVIENQNRRAERSLPVAIRDLCEMDIVVFHFPYHYRHTKSVLRGQAVRYRARFTGTALSLFLLASLSSSGGAKQDKVVYVCACLKTKSCFCMTDAKMEGPCACGTQGGPPMKPVTPDSEWAKENRDALAK
jgi:hypothetical protein